MEKIKMIFGWLKTQPKWLKSIAVVVVALVAALLIFSSCSTLTTTLPDITKYEIGVEGVATKEATTTKTTKWYLRPDES